MKRVLYIFIMACALAGCCENNDMQFGDNLIALNASIFETNSTTRALKADEVRGDEPSREYPLEVLACFSTTSGAYSQSPTPVAPSYLPCNTTINYIDKIKTFPDPYEGNNLKQLKYPSDNSPVYCVGLYPKEDWSFPANNKIRYEINGEKDVMFAPEISGKWEYPFTTQTFTHMQAWLRIVICANNKDAIEAWGGIDSIKIKSRKYIDIDLAKKPDPSVAASFAAEGGIEYTGEKGMIVVSAEDSVELSTQLQEVCSFFYIPLNITNDENPDQTILIYTKNKGVKEVHFKLVDKDNKPIKNIHDAISKLYVLELHFQPFDFIKANCALKEWEAWDDNLYME